MEHPHAIERQPHVSNVLVRVLVEVLQRRGIGPEPLLGCAADALFSRTAQLPRVDLIPPKTVIGRDTISSIQAGLIIGHTGLVDEIVGRMQAELGQAATVIATGGLASLIAPESRTIQEVRPFLTLEGLELLYRRTRGDD